KQLFNIKWITSCSATNLFNECLRKLRLFSINTPELEQYQLLDLFCWQIGQWDFGEMEKLADARSKHCFQLGRAIGDRDQDREIRNLPADHFQQIMRERIEPVTIFQHQQEWHRTSTFPQTVDQQRFQ